MMASKKVWSDDDNVKLIQLVKDNIILWDARHDEYKLSERKPIVWRKIAEDFGTDSGECFTINYHCSIYLVKFLLASMLASMLSSMLASMLV